MKNGLIDLDHLMISAAGSDRAGATFECMGFTLTPRSELPGMSNRLICFPSAVRGKNNFIEFLSLDDRAKAPAIMHDILGASQKPVSMVMASPDARKTNDALETLGLAPQFMEFKRDWRLPSGEVISPEFRVCIPKPGVSPLMWNVCEYLNGELYQRPDFIRHKNTARRFSAALALADDPPSLARHYETVWGAKAAPHADGSLAVSPGPTALRLYAPERAAQLFPGVALPARKNGAAYLGFEIEVGDLRAALAQLDAAGVRAQARDGSVWIVPADAHGCLVVLAAA
jgi:hypothetical protein